MVEALVDSKFWPALLKRISSQPMVLAALLDSQTWTVVEYEPEASDSRMSCFSV